MDKRSDKFVFEVLGDGTEPTLLSMGVPKLTSSVAAAAVEKDPAGFGGESWVDELYGILAMLAAILNAN